MKEITRIGKERAIALYDSKWWEGQSARMIAGFQLSVSELCLPFSLYHRAMEEVLGRPVYTHEFGSSNYEYLCQEFHGERAAPSFKEIIDLLPADKKILILTT